MPSPIAGHGPPLYGYKYIYIILCDHSHWSQAIIGPKPYRKEKLSSGKVNIRANTFRYLLVRTRALRFITMIKTMMLGLLK